MKDLVRSLIGSSRPSYLPTFLISSCLGEQVNGKKRTLGLDGSKHPVTPGYITDDVFRCIPGCVLPICGGLVGSLIGISRHSISTAQPIENVATIETELRRMGIWRLVHGESAHVSDCFPLPKPHIH